MAADLAGVRALLEVMERLRDPDTGCPWDQKQTMQSLLPYTQEEVYEVMAAIEQGNMDEIADELGDLLFQVVFYAKLGAEQAAFDFDSIAAGTAAKLIRRHPHVYAEDGRPLGKNDKRPSDAEIKARWEQIKQQERLAKAPEESTVFRDIPHNLPAILMANKLQKRAASVGFDWTEKAPVLDKIEEELDEVRVELERGNQEAIAAEIGDLLFAVVNLARHCQVNPEAALQQTNRKFKQRFQAIEANLAAQGLTPAEQSLAELEALWGKVKANEK